MNVKTISAQGVLGVLSTLCLSLLCGAAHAVPDQAETAQVHAQLIASVDAVHPGEQILLGVQQQIAPQWHTYWRNPGDSGFSTRIAWDLPTGASAGAIEWPTPAHFTFESITNYGYENSVVLLSPITVPQHARAGSTFPVKAKVNWLVCKDVCIPQQVELGLSLPVIASNKTAHNNPLITNALTALPQSPPWPLQAQSAGRQITLKIKASDLPSSTIKEVHYYADQAGEIVHGGPQPWQFAGDTLVLKLPVADTAGSNERHLRGVLAITTNSASDGNTVRGYLINTTLEAAGDVGENGISINHETDLSLVSALLLALLGGVILNLMPCVFPVLSIKALSLLDQAQQTRRQARLHGVLYTLGVLASFTLLGAVLIALKAGGAQIGWGFQFQSPSFVLVAAYLMFAVGLSLSGVFSIGASVTGLGSSLAGRSGYAGSFFTGVLATIVATPCTAPFMGGALGYALTQPPAQLMAVFLSLGFGLALPYLLLSNWPLLQRWLPRPGRWMEQLKQVLAFPMYGAAVWLVWVLAQQAGTNAIATALGGMVIIAFAAWLFETTRNSGNVARRSGSGVAALALILALAGGYLGIRHNADSGAVANSPVEKTAAPYSTERLRALRAAGKPVFVNFTAAWCITCLVNERVALGKSSVVAAFKQADIAYLKGDWTNQDQQITRELARFGRSGVPLYVFYPHGMHASPIVLPQLLTPDIVLAALHRAAPPSAIAP